MFTNFSNNRSDRDRSYEISGCGLAAVMNENGERMRGDIIINSIAVLHDRGNGLGGGFAGYGIYPEFENHYAFHLMFETAKAKFETEELLNLEFDVAKNEEIPTRHVPAIKNPPMLHRYFVTPRASLVKDSFLNDDDFVVKVVMKINSGIEGAFVISSGKNMGAFKAVGYPEEVAEFFRLDEYYAYTWIGHGRFPTNTPGWWGGAHPFTILDWAIVHNGEISSYGTNRRYLEMFGYQCTMMTDTEVMAYLFDLLLRKHKLPVEIACKVIAAPFWQEIERMPEDEKRLYRTLRIVYANALVNGPFAIVLGFNGGMVGLNDRIKLRPLVAARWQSNLYLASEEAAIREICPKPETVWSPRAGEPVIGRIKSKETSIQRQELKVAV